MLPLVNLFFRLVYIKSKFKQKNERVSRLSSFIVELPILSVFHPCLVPVPSLSRPCPIPVPFLFHPCPTPSHTRVCQKSTFFEIKDEYPWKLFLLGHWYWKYKFFHSNPLFSSSPGFLTVLHLPSGVENFWYYLGKILSDPKGTAFRGIHFQIQFWCKFGTPW